MSNHPPYPANSLHDYRRGYPTLRHIKAPTAREHIGATEDIGDDNQLRAKWAGQSVLKHAQITATPRNYSLRSATADLLVDLLHFCDAYGFDFAAVEKLARGQYLKEIGGEA